MKRVVFNYLVVAAMSVSAAFMSCNNEKVKLLETTTYSDGRFEKFEYDNENRITKTTHYDKEGNLTFSKTISYNGNEFVKVMITTGIDPDFVAVFEYSKSGNKITITIKSNNSDNVDTVVVDLDNSGFPTKYVSISDISSSVGVFEIQDGNLTKHSYKVIHDDVTLE